MEGLAFQKSGAMIAAEQRYLEVLQGFPENPDALHLLGILAQRRGQLDQAEAFVRRALKVLPQSVDFSNTLATVLADMGCHLEAIEILRVALKNSPDALRPRTNLLFLLHLLPGVTRDILLAEHVEWARRHIVPKYTRHSVLNVDHHSGGETSNRRFRVGYVSADFSGHPVGRILSAVLPHHNRQEFEIFCYDNGSACDEQNRFLRSNADHWVNVECLDDKKLVDRIRADRLNVLVDLSGHTRGSRLISLGQKPAPVQAAWLGYLSTTGMQAIDWRITDRRTDPEPDASRSHVEGLWYLPDCLWPWKETPSIEAIEVGEPPSTGAGFITFGSFNTFRKINYRVIDTWADLLVQVPDSRLRIYGAPLGRAVELVYEKFEAAGVSSDRVDLFSPVEYLRYLRAYNEVDIALDTFPYCGGATTCESLWMGVPVITLAGIGGFARTGAGLLGSIGLEEYIASDIADYVRIATQLARDPLRLSVLRSTLRNTIAHSLLADASRFVRNLEIAYKGMWQLYIDRQAKTSGSSDKLGR